jgi:2-polyprenyl-6-methoxyphenol hydroxylase-like FAD-dependent oxidoreductase
VICGAGIAGLTAAWWLDRHGWDVLAVEQAPELRGGGYMIDFFGSGYDVAEAMGLLPRLRELCYDFGGVTYVDRRGRPTSRLSYHTFAAFQHGRLLNLMRGDLELALFEALGGRVAFRFGHTVAAVTERPDGRIGAVLDDGTVERADLLVGADGIHSRIRELVFGPEHRFIRQLGYHTAAYVFPDAALRQRLHGGMRILPVPGRQAGFYPLRGELVGALYAHRSAQPALPADPKATLGRLYRDLGWVVPDALARCPDPPSLYFDQVAQVELPCWSSGRVTLVGDACQAVSLLAGQGASLAMGGAYVLAQELAAGPEVPAALDRYEARLRPVARREQAAGRRTAEWFLPSSRRRIIARDVALRAAALPGVRRLLRPLLTPATPSVVPREAVRSG